MSNAPFTKVMLSAICAGICLFASGADRVSAQAVGDFASVATERLNLRSGPGTSNPVIREMPEGTGLRIDAVNDGWAKVTLLDSGVTGWTSLRFLAERAQGDRPTDERAFFAGLRERYGEPGGTGYLPELDVHYAYYCRGRIGLALYRAGDQRAWEAEEHCITDVQGIDIDKNGSTEIVYFSQGGGSGTFAVIEAQLSWPVDALEPIRGYEYATFQHDQMGGPPDLPVQIGIILESKREMRYGEDCGRETYCPFWPPDAPCREVTMCAITEEKTMKVMGPAFPRELRGNPVWVEYVTQRYEQDGFKLIGDEIPPELSELILEDLEALDAGGAPELTEERQSMVDAWLQ